jgi:hypothetical protein
MRLIEIEQGTADEQRVKRLRDTAKTARDRATQLGKQARVSADQLKMQKSRERLSQARRPSTQMIKPQA